MRLPTLLIDVDEVLCDFQKKMYVAIRRILGRSVTQHDTPGDRWDMFHGFAKEEVQAFFAEIEQPGFCSDMEPLPGAIEAVAELRKIVEVVPVTSPFHTSPTWVFDRAGWLGRHFGWKPNEIINTSAKHHVEGDAFLDDNPHHVEKWTEENPRGVGMLWHTHQTRKMPYHSIRVHSWDEVIKKAATLRDRTTVYDLLGDYEFVHQGGNQYEGNSCLECGAFAKGSALPTHAVGCMMDELIRWNAKRT